MLSSCERVGWATSRSASASRWSASARPRSRLPAWTIRAGSTSVANSFASASVSGPAITSSSFAASSGPRARELAEGHDQGRRVAAVAAEAAGVDERGALAVEQLAAGAGLGRPGIRVPAVSDQQRVGDPAGAQVRGRRLGDADDGVGGAEPASLEPAVEAPLEAGREGRSQGLERPRVADVGDPGDAAALERAADRVRGLRRRGRDHAVEAALAMQAQCRAARERRPGGDQGLGDEHPAQRVRATAVGGRVEHRPDRVLAAQAGAPALRVGGLHDPVLGARPVGRGGEDGDLVAEAPQPLRHRRGAQDAGVAAGRVEVGDEQDRALHRPSLRRRSAIAPA